MTLTDLLKQKKEVLKNEILKTKKETELETHRIKNIGYYSFITGGTFPLLTKKLASENFLKSDTYEVLSENEKKYIKDKRYYQLLAIMQVE